VLVPWTPLAPSQRERRLRQLGAVLAVATAATVLITALRSEPFDVALAALALLLAVAAAWVWRARRAPSMDVAIDADGRLLVRSSTGVDVGPSLARCRFAAPWLISIRSGTMWVPIWPDSVPPSTFRRLWVHIRWSSGRVTSEPSADRSRQPQ
jgi:hypothetical protein